MTELQVRLLGAIAKAIAILLVQTGNPKHMQLALDLSKLAELVTTASIKENDDGAI